MTVLSESVIALVVKSMMLSVSRMVMVTFVTELRIAPLASLVSVRLKFKSPVIRESLMSGTSTVWLTTPGPNVTVALVGSEKLTVLVAVPSARMTSTVTE